MTRLVDLSMPVHPDMLTFPRVPPPMLMLAATTTDGVESTATATARVELFPHRPLMPRLRIPLAVGGALLLAAAVAVEVWRRL